MSHVEQVEVVVYDLPALAAAARARGGRLNIGQTQHAWWGYSVEGRAVGGREASEFGKCAHAIQIDGLTGRNGSGGPWEIGVVARPEGGFNLVYDAYGGAGAQLEKFFGVGLSALTEEYAAAVAMNQLTAEGFMVERLDGPQIAQGF